MVTPGDPERMSKAVEATAAKHEAIGRYVVGFSRLLSMMEHAIVLLFGAPLQVSARVVLHGARGPDADRTQAVFRHLMLDRAGDRSDLRTVIVAFSGEVQKAVEVRAYD